MTPVRPLDQSPRLLGAAAPGLRTIPSETALAAFPALLCVALVAALALLAALRLSAGRRSAKKEERESTWGAGGESAPEVEAVSLSVAAPPVRSPLLPPSSSPHASDYGHLDSVVHADHAGAPPPPARLVRAAAEALLGPHVPLGNPHSAGAWGDARWGASHPAARVPGAAASARTPSAAPPLPLTPDSLRTLVARHLGVSLDDFSVIFTAGATDALKLVAEAFPWSAGADARQERGTGGGGVETGAETLSTLDEAREGLDGSGSPSAPKPEASEGPGPSGVAFSRVPPRGASRFVHLADAHSSVLAIRQTVLKRGGAVACYVVEHRSDRDEDCTHRAGDGAGEGVGEIARGNAGRNAGSTPGDTSGDISGDSARRTPAPGLRFRMRSDGWVTSRLEAVSNPPPASSPVCSLLAYPAESNVCGRRYPAELAPLLVRSLLEEGREAIARSASSPRDSSPSPPAERWLVLVDAAKAAASPDARAWLDLSRADLVALSLYKLFGFPTGLGALLVRRSTALPLLRPAFVGGGATRYVLPWTPEVAPLDGPDGFASGTPNFQAVPAAILGFAWLEAVANEYAKEEEERTRGQMGGDKPTPTTGPSPPSTADALVLLARRSEVMAEAFARGLAALRHAGGAGRPLARILGARAETDAGRDDALGGRDEGSATGAEAGPLPPPSARSSTVAFVLFSPDGAPIPSGDVARQLSLRGVLVRSGLLCNPGGVAEALGVGERELVLRRDPASASCAGDADVVEGRHVTLVRVSFGLASDRGDPRRILQAIADQYLFEREDGRHDTPAACRPGPSEKEGRDSAPEPLSAGPGVDRALASPVNSSLERTSAPRAGLRPTLASASSTNLPSTLTSASPAGPLPTSSSASSTAPASPRASVAAPILRPPKPRAERGPAERARPSRASPDLGGEDAPLAGPGTPLGLRGALSRSGADSDASGEGGSVSRGEPEGSEVQSEGRERARGAAEGAAAEGEPRSLAPQCASPSLVPWWTPPSSSSGPGSYLVRSLFVFPLKGARGFSPSAWPLGPQGLAHDRHWAVRELGQSRALTPKSCPGLGALQASVRPPPGGWHDPPRGSWPGDGLLELEMGPEEDAGDAIAAEARIAIASRARKPRLILLALSASGELRDPEQARADAWLSETLGRPVQLVTASSLKGKKKGGAGGKAAGAEVGAKPGGSAVPSAAPRPRSPPASPAPAPAASPPSERLPLRISTAGGVLALTAADLVELHAALERPLLGEGEGNEGGEEREAKGEVGSRATAEAGPHTNPPPLDAPRPPDALPLPAASPSPPPSPFPTSAPSPLPISPRLSSSLEDLALRFRPNLLLACDPSERAFASDDWHGLGIPTSSDEEGGRSEKQKAPAPGVPPALVALGSCPRCDRVCYDPSTGRRADAEPLLTLSRLRKGHGRVCFGALLDAQAQAPRVAGTEPGEDGLGDGWSEMAVGQPLEAAWRVV